MNKINKMLKKFNGKNNPYRKYLKLNTFLILLFVFLIFVVGCSYYKVTTSQANASVIEQIQMNEKYIIVHQGSNAWHLKGFSLNDEQKEISGFVEALPEDHQNYLTTNPHSTNRYKPREEDPTIEVHIYISEYVEGAPSQIKIALSSVSKIEIYDKAIGATTVSHVFATLAGVVGAIAIIGVIVLLTKSSCPFVYIRDGNSYHFIGELYGGAIYSSLERDDYMPIPDFNFINGDYQLKISNELLERAYTNLAELIVIEHQDNSNVIIDKTGNIQTIQKPESCSKAISDENIDYTKSILLKDSISFLFNDDNNKNKELSNLTLTFKKPLNSKNGKLILNAKNSFWLDYIYGKLNEQFGTYYNEFVEKHKKDPATKKIQWSLDQGIPLSVYVETEAGWEFIDYFNAIGPLATRDIIMPVDLSRVKTGEVRIKLECGFMFWEIDYAAMDFSENIPMSVTHLAPVSSIDEDGNEVSSLIASTDNKYLIQPEVGNEVIIKYVAPTAKNNNVQSFFLHSRGYYEYIRDYKGKPNLIYLSSFRNKGAFTRFSKQHYYEFVDNKDFLKNVLSENNAN